MARVNITASDHRFIVIDWYLMENGHPDDEYVLGSADSKATALKLAEESVAEGFAPGGVYENDNIDPSECNIVVLQKVADIIVEPPPPPPPPGYKLIERPVKATKKR